MTRNLDGTRDPMAFFGAELRRARMAAGMTLEQLGQKMNFSGDMVGRVEACERSPSPKFAERCDEVFPQFGGLFGRLLELARRSGRASPRWFRPWIEIEGEAISLRTWQPLLIPGLLQTEDYARAIYAVSPDAADEEVEGLVAARMERQAVLERDRPPLLWAVMGETILYRCAGSPKVMRDQLTHVAEMSCRKNIMIQIVPAAVGAHDGLAGAFVIAGLEDGESTLYLAAIEGQIIDRLGAASF